MENNLITINLEDLTSLISALDSSPGAMLLIAMLGISLVVLLLKPVTIKIIEFASTSKERAFFPHHLAKRMICYNQGKIAEIEYLASMYHKILRVEMQKDEPDLELVKRNKDALVKTTVKGIRTVCYKNFEFLHEYFHGRHVVPPRISLKGNREPGQMGTSQEELIFTLARCVNSRRDPGLGVKVSENSGFQHIAQYGSCYIEQNIPKATKDGKYWNSRLDSNTAKHISPNWLNKALNIARKYFYGAYSYDQKWASCWTSVNNPLDPLESYKSTLIIPITFWNNTDELNNSFLQKLKLFRESDLDGEPARAILGYLCFDHVDTHFFNKAVDKNVGYIFADIISLYLISLQNYTSASQIYDQAVALISENS